MRKRIATALMIVSIGALALWAAPINAASAAANDLTAGPVLGTAYIDSTVTYSDVAMTTSILCIGLLMFLVGMIFLVIRFLAPQSK